MERKNPAGITSNPAYFMAFSFQVIPAIHRLIQVGPGPKSAKEMNVWQKTAG